VHHGQVFDFRSVRVSLANIADLLLDGVAGGVPTPYFSRARGATIPVEPTTDDPPFDPRRGDDDAAPMGVPAG
jgi:hypothetical protein